MFPFNYQEQFLKYKDIIIEEIIQEFGEQYRADIIERINSHVIILQSNPLDDYIYLCNHSENIKPMNRWIIKGRYRKLEKIKEKARNKLLDEFKWMISTFFRIDKTMIDQKYNEEFASLFGNQNFDESYIDSYSSSSMNLLNRIDTPQIVKESILNDQRVLREKLSEFGIIIDEQFINHVDEFLEKRKLEKDGYYRKILKSHFSYNKELSSLTRSEEPEYLFYASFYPDPNQTIATYPEGKVQKHVFYPVIRRINGNFKALDVLFIHELVHTIGKSKEQSIMNEIVVQKAAINITKRLHENGIFIFDDKEQCLVEGECTYEVLFPLIEPILSNYDNLLKETLVNSSFSSLSEVFGESWNRLLEELEKVYATYKKMKNKIADVALGWNTDLSNIDRCIEEIIKFYSTGGKYV